ncbi:LAMI_0F08438g1_1 [Lachancea mirantina]|uniref:LAMI_0F08438g1_1 n=1 Tax=Lachancea mirantina TaxID=1230905 RepID=A0A1G4K0F6_9SACH|nr:LAMI_0F08438g1_1 [Lachancea mirantina]
MAGENVEALNCTVSFTDKARIKQITLRGTVAGLGIGSLVLISNFQFGLQTGWVSMMSLPSALLACAIFRQLWPIFFTNSEPFTDVENVYIQSAAIAVGTGPLAFGFVGVIPAIEHFLTPEESGGTRTSGERFTFVQLFIWSLALAFFGVFFAVPLRKQVIVREKLPFPSGSATATLIAMLNKSEILQEISPKELEQMRAKRLGEYSEVLITDSLLMRTPPERSPDYTQSSRAHQNQEASVVNNSAPHLNASAVGNGSYNSLPGYDDSSYDKNISLLSRTFMVSSAYTILSYFLPLIKAVPVFGNHLSKTYLWNFQPSPAYIGQGIIMGLPTVTYMLIGCFLGWGILAPLARYKGWVDPDADVNDWEKGIQGWILWSSLAVMVVDSVVGFVVFTTKSTLSFCLRNNKKDLLESMWDDSMESMLLEEEQLINRATNQGRRGSTVKLVSTQIDHEVDSKHLIKYTTVISGLIVSSLICVVSMIYLFGSQILPVSSMIMALILALFLSILAVRALGETDLNPVSGIGKLSQLIFAVITPPDRKGAVLLNLVAGGIAEAGAQQAGDLMQDLKTGHLLGASPKAQFVAQMIGATWSIFLSSIMYIFYNRVYEIPSTQFRIPTAAIWIDCARLVTGQGLPEKAVETSIILGSIWAIISLVKNIYRDKGFDWLVLLPSGVAVGVGVYNSPSFTIARFIGGCVAHYWLRTHSRDGSAKTSMIVFSSGLVLGEGVCSIFNMIFTSLNVPHL